MSEQTPNGTVFGSAQGKSQMGDTGSPVKMDTSSKFSKPINNASVKETPNFNATAEVKPTPSLFTSGGAGFGAPPAPVPVAASGGGSQFGSGKKEPASGGGFLGNQT